MINKAANRLAATIVSNGAGEEARYDWYVYGLQKMLGRLVTYGAMVVIAAASCVLTHSLDKLWETGAFLLFMLTLRSATGGYHADSHFVCFVSSVGVCGAGVFVLPHLLALWPPLWGMAVAIAGLVVVVAAPVIHPNLYQRAGHRKKMRQFSLLVLSVQTLVLVAAGMLKAPANLILASSSGTLLSSMLLLIAKLSKQEGQVYEEE